MSVTAPLDDRSQPLPEGSRFDRLQKTAYALVGLGALMSLVALWLDSERFAFGYLWGYTFIWAVALGSLFFVGLHHITHSVWSVVIRRIAEMFASLMPLILVLMIPLFIFAFFSTPFSLFPWTDMELVQGDHVLEQKLAYLNVPFFVVRGILFGGIWALFARFFVNNSLSQDNGEFAEQKTLRMRKWSTVFMPVFALTITFASFDWLMSLEPHWFSTIYGVYVFSGVAATGLAAITIAVVWLRSVGLLDTSVVRADHLYNLGALLFTFTCFWAYIAFSQFMLIWYASIPEETVYYIHRMHPGWLEVTVVLAFVRFIVPFFLLLSRPAKMDPRRLLLVSVLVLIGQLLDLYWLIMPALHRAVPRLGWQEVGPVVLLVGLIVLFVVRFLSSRRLTASGDPLFAKSVDFHL